MLFKYVASAAAIAMLAAPPMLCGQQNVNGADCAKVNDSAVDHVNMDHAAHLASMMGCEKGLPTLPGQSAYGAISEVVRLLKADPKTDWSRVNIEALRQHLIDMDAVTMRAAVAQRNVPGGAEMDVTGDDPTAAAIKRMAVNHAMMLDQGKEYHATSQALPNGARITVTAKDASDTRTVAQIRGLGFAGLMTEGDHHAAHHIALARGEPDPHGH